MNRRNGQIGVMDRSEALKILGISKEQDDELQAKFANGNKLTKPSVNSIKKENAELKRINKDLTQRVCDIEKDVNHIKIFLCINRTQPTDL